MATGPLSGKVALVTGAGSSIGMGRAMALALAAAGARVAMMDVDAASLERSAGDVREIGGDDAVLPIVGDISAWDDAQRAVRETIDGLGGLHVLINHAGINERYAGLPESEHPPFWELPPEVWRRGGPRALVTSKAVFSFDPGRARFRLESVHGGETPETVAKATGFAFDRAPEVGETPAPTSERLERLRRDIAPQVAEFYPQFAARVWGLAA